MSTKKATIKEIQNGEHNKTIEKLISYFKRQRLLLELNEGGPYFIGGHTLVKIKENAQISAESYFHDKEPDWEQVLVIVNFVLEGYFPVLRSTSDVKKSIITGELGKYHKLSLLREKIDLAPNHGEKLLMEGPKRSYFTSKGEYEDPSVTIRGWTYELSDSHRYQLFFWEKVQE